MQWIFLGLAVFFLIILGSLTFYFLCYKSEEPVMDKLNKIDNEVSQLDELPKITKLLEELREELKGRNDKR